MPNLRENAPKVVPTASGADGSGSDASVTAPEHYHSRPSRKRLVVKAIGPDELSFTVTGQNARALLALVEAGHRGVTALDVAAWAFRLSAYCFVLRHRHCLSILTFRDEHEGGTHGRYVLQSSVMILRTPSG